MVLEQGGAAVYTFENVSVGANDNGLYTGTIEQDITPGTYDVLVKGWAHLQRKFTVTLNPGLNTPGPWITPADILKAGDVNGDNRVDSVDFKLLAADYLNSSTQAGSLVDFNLDARVDSTDFDLLAGNYNQEGEK